MSAPVIEFARGLELVCRHINPPAAPLPEPISLPYLGLDGIPLRGDDPCLAYRYVRGLEIPGARGSLSQAKPVWAAERGTIAPVAAALEVEPGVLAVGDATGVVRMFVRAGRARWECAAALPAHSDSVRDMCVLGGGGCASVGDDGVVVIYERDWRGLWRLAVPRIANPRNGWLSAVCQLADGTVLAGGAGSRLVELVRLPSGEWEGREAIATADTADIVAVAPWAENGYCTLQLGRLICWLRNPGGVRSLTTPAPFGPITDIGQWKGGVIACTEAGELVHYQPSQRQGDDNVEMTGGRAASARMQGLRTLAADRVATWSEDQQIRIWQTQDLSFTLKAAFPAALLTPRSFAVLSDERIAFSEPRGFAVAAPQLDGTWRTAEVVSAYEPSVTALAPLARDRVAFVQGATLHILSNTVDGVLQADELPLGDISAASLAALDADRLALGAVNGRLRLAGPGTDGWTLVDGPTVHRSTVEHLSVGRPYLATGDSNGGIVVWTITPQGLTQQETLQVVTPLLALAMHPKGRLATATPTEVLVQQLATSEATPGQVARISTSTDRIGLSWDGDDLLAVDRTGAVTRIRISPTVQETLEWAPTWGGSAPARVALVRTGAPGPAAPLRMAYARGTAPIDVGPALRFSSPHGRVDALAAADDVLYVGADALYVCQPSAVPPVMRRIAIVGDAIVDALLSPGGPVISALVRRRDGSPWLTTNIGGKAVPADPVLHAAVAVIEESGQLGEIAGTGNYVLSPDRRELRIEDPTVPPA